VGYHAAFTITDLRVHDPDFGVHDGPILAFTMRRSSCSPWTDASSTPVFAGTRVPVQTLIEYLEGGDSLTAFLDDFPSVSREHAIAVLEEAKSALLAKAVAA